MSIDSFDEAIEQLAGLEGLTEKIAEAAAPRIDALLEQEFAGGHGPYGEAWEPLRPSTLARGRTPPPLTDTGAMRSSAEAEADGSQLVWHIEDPAEFHQHGTSRMAARPILPEDGLPETWSSVITEIANELVGGA